MDAAVYSPAALQAQLSASTQLESNVLPKFVHSHTVLFGSTARSFSRKPAPGPRDIPSAVTGRLASSDFCGLAWIDGGVVPLDEARVPVTDRGFLFADSVYDTVRTYGRQPFLLGDHLDRLRRSAEELGILVPWADDELISVVVSLMEQWPEGAESSIRLIVTRGDGGHGLALPDPPCPRLVVLARALEPLAPRMYERGVRIGRPPEDLAKESSVPAHVKSGSYLSNVLALRSVRAEGAFEGLLRGADNSWAEATTSNLFLVKDGVLLTPGIEDQILPGITRALVLSLAAQAELSVVERPLFDADLEQADEIFLTSSLKEVLPVSHLDNQPVGRIDEGMSRSSDRHALNHSTTGAPGPVTRDLIGLYRGATNRLSAAAALRLRDVFPE